MFETQFVNKLKAFFLSRLFFISGFRFPLQKLAMRRRQLRVTKFEFSKMLF